MSLRPAGKRGLPVERQLKLESGSTCATSRRQARRRVSALRAAGEGALPSYVPISAIPDEPVLKPWACAPTTFRSTPSVPAFEDLAVLVDEEVVADVVPAVSEHVVALDAPDDRGRLGPRVRVRPRGVMDDREAERVRVARPAAADPLVRAPARRARRSAASPRSRQRAPALRLDRAPHVVRAHAGDAAGGAHLRSGSTAPSSTGCPAASRAARSSRLPASGHRPPAPRPASALHRPDTLRVRNETEPLPFQCRPTRSNRAGALFTPARKVARDHGRPCCERGAGSEEEKKEGEADESHGRRFLRKQRPGRPSRSDGRSQIESLQVKGPLLRVISSRARRDSLPLRHCLSYAVGAACPGGQVRERRQSRSRRTTSTSEIERAKRRGLRRGRDPARHAGRAQLDAMHEDLQGRSSHPDPGDRLRLTRRAPALHLPASGSAQAADSSPWRRRRTSARRRRSTSAAKTSPRTCGARSSTTQPHRSASSPRTHGRNVKWADAAVRRASNLGAQRSAQAERHRRDRAPTCPRSSTRSTDRRRRAEEPRHAHGRRGDRPRSTCRSGRRSSTR